jgi:hypothetical protein
MAGGGGLEEECRNQVLPLIWHSSFSANCGELGCGMISCSLIILHALPYMPAQVTCKLFEMYCSLLNITAANRRHWAHGR